MEYFVQFTYKVGHSFYGPFSDPDEAYAFSINPLLKTHDLVQTDIVQNVNGAHVNPVRETLIELHYAHGLPLPPELQNPEEEVVAPE